MAKTETTTSRQKKATTNGAKPATKSQSSKKAKGGKRKAPTADELLLQAIKKIQETGFYSPWRE
ncbi:MAG: hypothetical protein HY231_16260 [Acidobacteria bacterium]|nr:hypothetical protein [Acidobacteriota bacterium]